MRGGESPIRSSMTVNDRPQLTVCSRTYRSAKQKGRELPAPFVPFLVPRGSVALAGVGREEFLIFAFDALIFVGVGGAVLLGGDVRPFGAELVVQLEPLLEAALGVGQDRLGRAFGLADAAVDTLVRIRSVENPSEHKYLMRISYAVYS